MDIVIYTSDPEAVVRLCRLEVGKIRPPMRRHPDRWVGSLSGNLSILRATADNPPGIYLARGRTDGSAKRQDRIEAIDDIVIKTTELDNHRGGHGPNLEFAATYLFLPQIALLRERIEQAMADAGVTGGRIVKASRVASILRPSATNRRQGFFLIVDGPDDVDLIALEAVLAEATFNGDPQFQTLAGLSGRLPDAVRDEVDWHGYWLDELHLYEDSFNPAWEPAACATSRP